jgi:glycosyltransferase involved in cell wall biosynthesis
MSVWYHICTMKTSIALATYNGEKYVEEQLDSYLTQTVLPDELIVSDDCSTDATQQMLGAFAKKAPFRVVLLCNIENVGYGQNFSRALSQTTGDLVFLSDKDDVWFPEKIAKYVAR